MSTANVNVINKSGRSIDAITIYHCPTEPDNGLGLADCQKVIDVQNLANGANKTGVANTQWGDPEDYWLGGVRFEGDGETYIISGLTFDPYKEYEVDNGDTLTITIPAYQEDSTNQGDPTFATDGDTGTAFLLNSTVSELIAWAKIVGEIVGELGGE